MTDTPNETRSRIALSFSQRTTIFEQLKTVCFQIAEGKCIYREGWSDQQVAEAMLFECNANHVHSIRVEMFGQLDKSQGSVPAEIMQRIETLEARIEELERQQWPAVEVACDDRLVVHKDTLKQFTTVPDPEPIE